jgi:hypothetical protein
MGNGCSTRWGMTVTRATVEGLPRLDVRALARGGALAPGTTTTVTWGEGATVGTEVAPEVPDVLVLTYRVSNGSDPLVPVREPVRLVTTPCTLGGARAWVVCPGCGTRCAVLYARGGLFRCRGCHWLAYASTRT